MHVVITHALYRLRSNASILVTALYVADELGCALHLLLGVGDAHPIMLFGSASLAEVHSAVSSSSRVLFAAKQNKPA